MAKTRTSARVDLGQDTLTGGDDLEVGASLGGPGSPGEVKPAEGVFTREEDKAAFVAYLSGELLDVRDGDERKQLETNWEKWRRVSMAISETAVRDTPWIRSSNVTPPLTMQKVQTVYAKLIAAFSVKKPPVAVTSLNTEDRDQADAMERFFKGMAENRYGLDVRRKFKQIAYDLVRLGTQPVKVPFKVDQWSFKRSGDAGTENVTYVRHQGPAIVPIRLEDFFIRPYWKDVQRAPWVGVRYRFFLHELRQMEAQGFLQDVDKVLGEALTSYDTNKEKALEQSGVTVGQIGQSLQNQEFELYECNVFWDADGDGVPEDLIVWIEPETGTVLRSQFNPLSVRDIEVLTYLENPESIYGVGICQMVEGPQETLTALTRMRLDGTQLSMLKMFLTRRGSGIGPNEELTPFKLMTVEDPQADFRTIDFPDISQGCLLGEQMAKEDADRVSGANDYMSGFNDKTVGSNATASGTQFLAGQANSILNSLLENTEQSMGTVYMLALYQCAANKELVDLSWLSVADQAMVREVLEMPVEAMPTKFRFNVRTTDINRTDESRKQSFMMATQLYNQYGQTAMQALVAKSNPQLAGSPDMQELLTSMYVGQTMMAAKVLEFFDVGNPDDFLPFVEHMKVQLRATDKLRAEQTRAMKEALNGGQGNGEAMPGAGDAQSLAGRLGGGLGPLQGPSGVPPMAGGALG